MLRTVQLRLEANFLVLIGLRHLFISVGEPHKILICNAFLLAGRGIPSYSYISHGGTIP